MQERGRCDTCWLFAACDWGWGSIIFSRGLPVKGTESGATQVNLGRQKHSGHHRTSGPQFKFSLLSFFPHNIYLWSPYSLEGSRWWPQDVGPCHPQKTWVASWTPGFGLALFQPLRAGWGSEPTNLPLFFLSHLPHCFPSRTKAKFEKVWCVCSGGRKALEVGKDCCLEQGYFCLFQECSRMRQPCWEAQARPASL